MSKHSARDQEKKWYFEYPIFKYLHKFSVQQELNTVYVP